jgi:uncharacterized protein (TIGR03437 family)
MIAGVTDCAQRSPLLAALWLMSAAALAQTTPQFTITTLAGSDSPGFSGDGGPAAGAGLNSPFGVAVDAAGNVYIADTGNSRVRIVTPQGVINTFAGNGQSLTSGDGGPAIEAGMIPFRVAVDAAGNLFIADQSGVIRKVDSSGTITTVAGNPDSAGYFGDGGLATDARLSQPDGVAAGAAGTLYIADTNNQIIRRVDAKGIITTVAGQPQMAGYAGDDGPATGALLNNPQQAALDLFGNLYIADQDNCLIRKVNTHGIITTLAGQPPASLYNPEAGYSGDGGPASAARLNYPADVAVDAGRNVYIADSQNNVIRLISADGNITTIAGNGAATYAGDGGPASLASLHQPWGLAVDASGDVYIADRLNNRIRMLTPAPVADSAAGSGLSAPLVTALSTNGLVTVFGSGFAPPGTALQPPAVKGVLPTRAARTCVQVGDTMAPLLFVSPTQINFQVPAVGAGGTLAVSVIARCGAAHQTASAPLSLTVAPAAPELLYFVHHADGRNPVAAIDNATGAYVGAQGLIPGAAFTPAQANQVVTIFGVGFGQTTPPQQPGVLATAAAQVSEAVVSLGGNVIAPLYVGVTPTYAGLYQVSLIVPSGLSSGPQPIQVTIGGVSSPPGAYLEVGP